MKKQDTSENQAKQVYLAIGSNLGNKFNNIDIAKFELEKLKINHQVIIEDLDIKEINNIIRIFKKYKINEVYNLAAQSFVHSSFQNPIETCQVNAIGVLNLLEVIRNEKRNDSDSRRLHDGSNN